MVHLGEYDDLKEWLKSPEDFVSVRPDLIKDHVANTVGIVFTAVWVALFSDHDIVLYEVLVLGQLLQLDLGLNLQLSHQGVLYVNDYSL